LFLTNTTGNFAGSVLLALRPTTMNVIGTFIERLTSVKGDRLRPPDLHDDGAFQHIDKCVRVMTMNRVCSAGRREPAIVCA
jgi:hypothetical protein